MKPHPEMTVDAILAEMLQADAPRAVGRPTSDAEAAMADAKMRKIIAAGRVRFQCAGCGGSAEAKDAACCACGGFVCAACQRTEEDGVCLHERPEGIPDRDDD